VNPNLELEKKLFNKEKSKLDNSKKGLFHKLKVFELIQNIF